MPVERWFGIVWALWAWSWLLAALWSDRPDTRALVRQEVIYRGLALVGGVLLFEGLSGATRSSLLGLILPWRNVVLVPVSRPVAVGLLGCVVAGQAFAWWARWHIGRLWASGVSRKADHHLVDTGPYGLVRHPIYAGIGFALLATAASEMTVTALLGASIIILSFYVKASLEEHFLRDQLGAEVYQAYARRVPMLIPFIGP